MRAPRTGRWGPEPIRGQEQELGRGPGRRAKEERREAGLCRPPVSFPILSPIPTSTPLGKCTCKEVQVPSLTLAPWTQGFRPQASQSDQTRSHLVTSLKFLSPVLPACCGQLYCAGVHRGLGSYCTVSQRKRWEREGMLTHPCPSPVPPQPSLSSWLFLSKCASEGRSLQASPQPQIPRQPSRPRSSASTPTPGRCSSHRTSERVPCARRGLWGRAWAFCPLCLRPQGQPGGRHPLQSLLLAFP